MPENRLIVMTSPCRRGKGCGLKHEKRQSRSRGGNENHNEPTQEKNKPPRHNSNKSVRTGVADEKLANQVLHTDHNSNSQHYKTSRICLVSP